MTEISTAKLSIDLRLVRQISHARVLDVGCGDGRHALAAAGDGARVVGLDYDRAELAKARRRCRSSLVTFIAADAACLPFRTASFDAVICTETLEHLPDDVAALDDLSRVLGPTGLLLGAVPSHFTEMLYWRLSSGYRNAPGGHLRVYRPRQLARRLADAGLDLRSLRYVHFLDSLAWLRFCLAERLRPRWRMTAFEQAVMIAVATERPVPPWRARLRAALPRSSFIGALEYAGALVWPKSLVFVAEKRAK